MKRLLLLLAAALLAGCAAPALEQPATETPADRAIAHWVGRPVAEAIGAWGQPIEEMGKDGRRLYIWPATHYGRSYYPANLDPAQPLPFGKTPEELACRGVMEVDEQGIVTRAEWVGYECHYLP